MDLLPAKHQLRSVLIPGTNDTHWAETVRFMSLKLSNFTFVLNIFCPVVVFCTSVPWRGDPVAYVTIWCQDKLAGESSKVI